MSRKMKNVCWIYIVGVRFLVAGFWYLASGGGRWVGIYDLRF